jgi:plastocyanin
MTRYFSARTLLLVVAATGALAIVPRVAGSVVDGTGIGSTGSQTVREVHLVVRDMTFYVDGAGDPNPTLYARPGERVRLVLQNTDVGMSHDFVIRSWSVKTRLLKGKGEDRVEFTVPDTRGAHVYTCSPHAEMMGGTIVVN